MRIAMAFVFLVAVAASAAPARADRPRLFPTLGAGMVLGPGKDIDGLVWAGVMVRPERGSGVFWSAAIEADLGDGFASFMPTVRGGGLAFADSDAWLHVASAYLIGGAGLRELHGEPQLVVRAGLGVQLIPLLYLVEAGVLCPDVLEVVTDVGRTGAVTSLRLSWGL